MKKLLFVIFLAFLLCSSHVFAQDFPTLTKYVNDYAGVLSDVDKAQINDLCSQIEQNWTVEIAVLTVNSTLPDNIDDYAVKTFEQNGIGKKDTDNGILIVVAVQDKKWRLEVGYGLEGILNDAKAGLIGRTYLVPNFQKGDYGAGLYQAVRAVGQVIANNGDDSFISDSTDNVTNIVIGIMLSTLFLTFIPLIVIFSIAFTEKCPRCGSRMRCRYQNNVKVCTCPKCGKKTRKKLKNSWIFFAGGMGGSGGWSGGGGGFGGGSSGGGGAGGSF